MARTRPCIGSARRSWLALAAAMLASAVTAGPAAADFWTPESGGSPNADEIDSLYKLLLIIAAVVFFGVEGALIWALVKFKAKKGAVAAQIHGNTRLEIAWTVIPAALLVFIVTFTFIKLPKINNPAATGENGMQFSSSTLYAATNQPPPPGGKGLKIVVDGMQYVWRFEYPGKDRVFTYEELVVPEDTTVLLDIVSDDVAHSWWIPKLGPKMDAIPGHVNRSWFKARRGVYEGQCAELCGRNHANMLARVRVLPLAEYEDWYDQQKADIKASWEQQAERRKELEAAEGEQATQGTGGGSSLSGQPGQQGD